MEDRKALISAYNEKYGTRFTTITEIYEHAGSSTVAADRLRVTDTTVLNWIRKEGGAHKVKGPGGPNRKSAVKEAMLNMTVRDLVTMTPVQLAKATGSVPHWCEHMRARIFKEMVLEA